MIQDFNEKIKNLYETEIGDFKRKALLYLNRLQEQIQSSNERISLDSCFYKIREMILCNETTDIELLRLQVLRKALQIEEKIQTQQEKQSL